MGSSEGTGGSNAPMATRFLPPPDLALTLSGPASVREGRRAIAALLSVAVPQDWHADATLATSELITNALTASGSCELSAWYASDPDCLRIEVADTSTGTPAVQAPDSARVGGHGLRIVAALSSRWGVRREPASKVVWCEFDG